MSHYIKTSAMFSHFTVDLGISCSYFSNEQKHLEEHVWIFWYLLQFHLDVLKTTHQIISNMYYITRTICASLQTGLIQFFRVIS